MTEADWLECPDPHGAMAWIREKVNASHRRLGLFAAAYCRLYWTMLDDERSRMAVEIAELFADGLATDTQRKQAASDARAAFRELFQNREWSWERFITMSVASASLGEWYPSVQEATFSETPPPPAGAGCRSERPHAPVIQCVFGNPFRPVAFDPHWRTADTVGLARGIYEDRAFDRLPLLADALMDAGCADEQVLGHCRSDGPHVRGCWVVDLVLGKE